MQIQTCRAARATGKPGKTHHRESRSQMSVGSPEMVATKMHKKHKPEHGCDGVAGRLSAGAANVHDLKILCILCFFVAKLSLLYVLQW